jgi:hypothetical protein
MKKMFIAGCSKMHRCKLSFAKSRFLGALEILRSEAY